jgi:hypothetical protein
VVIVRVVAQSHTFEFLKSLLVNGREHYASCSIKIKLRKIKMQKLKSKTMAILIALFLSFSMTASMTLLPSASAHTPAWQIPTYAYITAFPNPIGVGQTLIVYMWLDPVFGAAGTATIGSSAALLSNDYRFHNYELTITSPNGTSNTITFDIIVDSTSSQSYHFTPTQVGTYNLTFTFPGQAYAQYSGQYNPTSTLVNDTYLPSYRQITGKSQYTVRTLTGTRFRQTG